MQTVVTMKWLVGSLLTVLSLNVAALSVKCRNENECNEMSQHPDILRGNDIPRLVSEELTSSFWLSSASEFVEEKSKQKLNTKKAKNVIFFIGDGMSVATLSAARLYIGGEEKKLSFEKFPYVGLSRTFSVDKIVPDSAVTATGYLCGVKGNYGTIGVNGHIKRAECNPDKRNFVDSIAKWALDAGKGAGLVTTTRVTHASPAGVFAHIPERGWENNEDLKKNCGNNTNLEDIAVQLVHGDVGSRLKVILGGGKREFVNSITSNKGKRTDDRNLIEEWKSLTPETVKSVHVTSRKSFLKVNTTETDRILGLFKSSHMAYHLEDTTEAQPTLEEMTKVAIEILQKEDNGYFLFVEGGKIDLAHHSTKAKIAADETAEFSKAIDLARKITSEDDTLIVVSSDHAHTMSLSGYSSRNKDVFSTTGDIAEDGLPYLSLSYANGKGYKHYFDTKRNERVHPDEVDRSDPGAYYPSTVPMGTETHGGEDVGVFASGPWSHLFTGVYNQNTIPHMMAYAMCVGKGLTACDS